MLDLVTTTQFKKDLHFFIVQRPFRPNGTVDTKRSADKDAHRPGKP